MHSTWRSILVVPAIVSGLAATPTQGPAVASVMREKLGHAQRLLEAVVTSDWAGLEAHSRALERVTEDPRWAVLQYPEYARHSTAYVRAVQELRQAAARRDLEKTPQAYVAVTLTCVECHRYLARARIAR